MCKLLSRGHLAGRYRASSIAGALHLAIALFVTSCAAQPQQSAPPSTTMTITSATSLLAPASTAPEGIFLYRGVAYRVSIYDGPAVFSGKGVVYGLVRPKDIAGNYSRGWKKALWRNTEGVEIEFIPPMPDSVADGALLIEYHGPALPRN